jgi:predicted Zn-dependent protease
MSHTRIEQFTALVTQQPNNELFRFSLAQALLAAGRGADAREHLEFCCRCKADWMMPRIMLGKHLLAAGLIADAKPILNEALDLAVAQAHEDPASELRALLAGL